jgi:hypothetical protein
MTSLDACSIGKRQHFCFKRFILHRTEIVEKRLNPDRLDEHDHKHKRKCSQSQIQPPALRNLLQQQIRNPDKKKTENASYHERLKSIGRPFPEGLVRKIICMLPDKFRIVTLRQVDKSGNDRKYNNINSDDKKKFRSSGSSRGSLRKNP